MWWGNKDDLQRLRVPVWRGVGKSGIITLTEDGAILDDSYSQNVNPDDVYLSDRNDTINAYDKLDDATIEDPSTTDSDTLTASIGTDVSAVLDNIETLDIRSTNDNASLDFDNITGTNLASLRDSSTKDFTFENFNADGSVEARLNADQALTLQTAEASANDTFTLSVDSLTGEDGEFAFAADANGTDNTIDQIDLESRGAEENTVLLTEFNDGTDGYDGVDTLNLEGEADLNVTTELSGTDMSINSEELDGALNLGLDLTDHGTDSLDLSENIEGDVDTLTLINVDGSGTITTDDISGLEDVVLDEPDDTAVLSVEDGVEVSLIADDGTAQDIEVAVDGAGDEDNSDLTFNIGGEDQVEMGNLKADEIQNLTINSTGHEDGNTIGDGTDSADTSKLESLNLDASAELTLSDAVSMADGATDTFDTFTLNYSGEADIDAGTLTMGTDVNQLLVENEGDGAREFAIDAQQDLDTDVDEEEGGVDVTGEGAGDVTMAAAATDVSGLRVDASEYQNGDMILMVNAGAVDAIDADNFTGVDYLALDVDYQAAISNLDADTIVKFVENSATTGTTSIGREDAVEASTPMDLLFDADGTGAQGVGDIELTSGVQTLDLTTGDTEDGTVTIGTLSHATDVADDDMLHNLNTNVAENSDLVIEDYTTREGVDDIDVHEFTLTADGAGDTTVDNLANDNNLEQINLVNNGDGELSVGTLTLSTDVETARVTMDGSGDIDINTLAAGGAAVDSLSLTVDGEGEMSIGTQLDASDLDTVRMLGESDLTVADLNLGTVDTDTSIQLRGDGAVEIEDITGGVVEDETTLTIESSNGIESNVISGTIELGNSGGTGDAQLTIKGDQNLEFEDDIAFAAPGTVADESQVIDASDFDADLTIGLERNDDANSPHEFKLGTGNTEINVNTTSTDGDSDNFSFEFNGDGVADVAIDNFNEDNIAAGTDNHDILDFSAFAGATDISYATDTGELTVDGDADFEVTFEVQEVDGEDSLVGSWTGDGEGFEGTITLQGVDALDDLADSNFSA